MSFNSPSFNSPNSPVVPPRNAASAHRWLSAVVFWLAGAAFVSAAPPARWIDTLPQKLRDSIVWSADHEGGTLQEWTRDQFREPGSGIYLTGGRDAIANATREVAHTGRWSAEATIRQAVRARSGNRAVRLMVWTDRAWDDGGKLFPDVAHYSVWIYFPHDYNPNKYPPWDPGDGGWWNVFQFKSKDAQDESQPLWTLNVAHDDARGTMHFELYSKFNEPRSRRQAQPLVVPSRRWIHVEALYRAALGPRGSIAFWQDGQPIFRVDNVVTQLGGKAGDEMQPTWGIGNYTDHISGDAHGEGRATIYFDDAAVSTERLSQSLDVDSDSTR